MDDSLLRVEGVQYTWPGSRSPVLEGIDFGFAKGDRVGLIGPNGCGKTTLLQIMVGLVRPGAGKLLHRGAPVESKDDLRKLRLEVAYLFQNADDQLFSPTVIDDVAFGPLNMGLDEKEAKARAEETLEGLGLAHLAERITHRLSGGEKRLVSLATILSMRPRALLLDEPTNGLDPDTRDRLIDILMGLDMSWIIVSHDWDFLDQTTTTLWAMREGRLRASSKDILHRHVHAHDHGDLPHVHHD